MLNLNVVKGIPYLGLFNYIFGLTFQNPFSKWTLESKSEDIVENNIYHHVIFQNIFASANIIYNQNSYYVDSVHVLMGQSFKKLLLR